MKKANTKTHSRGISLQEWERGVFARRPGVKREYDALEPEFAVIRAMLRARRHRGVTQKEIARRAGTTQSAIARFESGASNPTLSFLTKVAAAVGAKIEVRPARR